MKVKNKDTNGAEGRGDLISEVERVVLGVGKGVLFREVSSVQGLQLGHRKTNPYLTHTFSLTVHSCTLSRGHIGVCIQRGRERGREGGREWEGGREEGEREGGREGGRVGVGEREREKESICLIQTSYITKYYI